MDFLSDHTLAVVGVIVSFIALLLAIMALPTIFQMWWGGPRLAVEFSARQNNAGDKRFVCRILNRTVKSRFLRKMGVRREPITVHADFSVAECGTNRVCVDTTRALLYDPTERNSSGKMQRRIETAFPIIFNCVLYPSNGNPSIIDDANGQKIAIGPGRYVVTVAVLSANAMIEVAREISIGRTASESYWLPN